jgi:hypothetical protein
MATETKRTKILTQWNTGLLEKLRVTQLTYAPPFTVPEGSLPCSQEPVVDRYPEPGESNPQSIKLSLKNAGFKRSLASGVQHIRKLAFLCRHVNHTHVMSRPETSMECTKNLLSHNWF